MCKLINFQIESNIEKHYMYNLFYLTHNIFDEQKKNLNLFGTEHN